MKKLALFLLAFVTCAVWAQSQTGQIKGTVTDSANAETLPFVSIELMQSGKMVMGATSDLDGKFQFTSVPPGTYDLRASAIGYTRTEINQVLVDSAKITSQNIRMGVSNDLSVVTVTSAKYEKRVQEVSVSLEVIRPNSVESKNATAAGITRHKKGSQSPSYGYNAPSAKGVGTGAPAKKPVTQQPNSNEFSTFKDNGFLSTRNEPLSTFSVDVDKASYTLVRKSIRAGYAPDAGAVRVEELINYFNYNYPSPADEHPMRIITAVTECPWNKDSRILKLALQGKRLSEKDLPPSSFTFLVDVSGSMDSPNKLPLVQASLLKLLDKMRPQDQIGIVVYAGAAGVVLETQPMGNKADVVARITEMKAAGSTAGGQGIQKAYELAGKHFIKGGNNRIILCTDGDFNVGVSSESELTTLIEQERQKGIYLTVLGYGMGNYKDSKLELLADKGNGNYAYIDDYTEAEKFLGKEFAGSMYTIAKDVKVQIEFNPAHVKSYRLIGYEDRLLEAEDFNNDKKDAGEIGSGHTVTALYEIRADEKMLAKIDSLKYRNNTEPAANLSQELATVKFRYKKPDGNESILMVQTIANQTQLFKQADESTRFAIAVAAFGQLLRKSEYTKGLTLPEIADMASAAVGSDEDGYRKEFMDMLKDYKKLDGTAKN